MGNERILAKGGSLPRSIGKETNMSRTTDLLLDIASEKNGYQIGEPWRFHELSLAAIIPITRLVDGVTRDYRLLSEVEGVKIKDTGDIDKMEISNKSGYAILVKAGEYVTGATQTRVLAVSQIIFSEEKVVVPCVCVHSSKGIRQDQQVQVGGYAPIEVRRAVYDGYRESGPQANYRYSPGLQQEVWRSVNESSRSTMGRVQSLCAMSKDYHDLGAFQNMAASYHTPMEDLAGRVQETQEKLKDVLKQIPTLDNQVGLCLVSLDGLDSLETFDHPDSWSALRKQLLKAEASKLADMSNRNGLFEFRMDKAKEIIRELLTSKFDEKVIIEKESSQTILLTGERFQGEVVTLRDEPVHCAFMRKAS